MCELALSVIPVTLSLTVGMTATYLHKINKHFTETSCTNIVSQGKYGAYETVWIGFTSSAHKATASGDLPQKIREDPRR
jgi:hypothetical protein